MVCGRVDCSREYPESWLKKVWIWASAVCSAGVVVSVTGGLKVYSGKFSCTPSRPLGRSLPSWVVTAPPQSPPWATYRV